MFAAEQPHGVRSWAKEGNPSLFQHFNKVSIFTEKAIAWVYRVTPASSPFIQIGSYFGGGKV